MAQLKDLIVYGDTKFLGDVTLDHDPTANLHAATKAYVDAQVGTGTDEKLKVGALTSGNTYYPILAISTDSGTAVTRQVDSTGTGFTYKATLGTSGASTAGTAILQVGNSLYVGQANNMEGHLRIYAVGISGAGTAKYSDICAQDGTESNIVYLPYGSSTYPSAYLVAASQRGTAIGSSTQPVFVNASGYIETCNSYTDTKVSLTSTTTSASYPLALGPSSITSGSAYGEYYNTSFYANPNTLTLYAPKLIVNNSNASYDMPFTVQSTGLSSSQGVALFKNNTATTASTTWISGFDLLAPNLTASTNTSYANFAAYNVGQARSACNCGNMAFHFSGAGSTANHIGFGLHSHDFILSVVATDRVGIMNRAPSYTLDVTGTIHASVGVKIGTSSEIKSIGTGLSIDSNGVLTATGTLPSDNVTGSGITGYIAKWSGESGTTSHTLTTGPAFGSATDTFLRNDGTWATPAGTSTDTKVTQTNITSATATGTFVPLLLVKGSGQTTTVTDTANFTQYLYGTPAGNMYATDFHASGGKYYYTSDVYTSYNSTLKAIEFIFS